MQLRKKCLDSDGVFYLSDLSAYLDTPTMLSLKLLRQALTDPLLLLPHHHHLPPPTAPGQPPSPPPPPTNSRSRKTLALLFTPTNEVVLDTCRLASIARDIGLNLNPTPSLSHIIFSAPSATQMTPFSSFFSLPCLPDGAVPLPFPSLSSASAFHLRAFASLANGYFRLVKIMPSADADAASSSNWETCGVKLVCRRSNMRVETMDQFSVAMTGAGWTLFKTSKMWNCSGDGAGVYLYRKEEANRVRIELWNDGVCGSAGEGRVTELRLPLLHFKNAPLRILQYIILMTENVFYLS